VSNLFDRRAKCTNFKLVRGQTTELRRPDRDAEGIEGKGMGRWCPLPSQVGGLGSVVSSPVGSRPSPAENEFWRILDLAKTHLRDKNLSFLSGKPDSCIIRQVSIKFLQN